MTDRRGALPISVVIPAYNGAAYVGETIRSVLEQSALPTELIVVDDHSKDATVDVVLRLAEQSCVAIRVIRLRANSGGPARPCNVGIEATGSPWIALLDQDDVWYPNKLEAVWSSLERYPSAQLIFGEWECIDTGGRVLPRKGACRTNGSATSLSPGDSLRMVADGQFALSMSNLVFRRTVWQRVGGFPTEFKICSDWAFLARAVVAGSLVVRIGLPLVKYRVVPTGLWQSSPYIRRNVEVNRVREIVLPHLALEERVGLSRKMALAIFDLANTSHIRGRTGYALWLYLWSLRYHPDKAHVLVVWTKTALKGIARLLLGRGENATM